MKKVAAAPLFAVAFAFSGLCASAALAAGEAEKGESKATACIACHGANGNSANPEWPVLAGQHEQYIHKQLQAFKGGARKNPLMSPMAMSLSDDDMADLGAYFSAQKPTGKETEASKLQVGQRVYRSGDPKTGAPACASCHGPTGAGNPPAAYPALRGQYATYVAAQLRAYRAGTRQTDPNQVMRSVAGTMSDEQIDAVASYVQGLR
ncbi:MAG TPA: c-type cytochrome [Steroidobacteraceae bacterium]|nr:c-type cytochrome [Steroidobacteraceae bacterium]